MFVLEVQRVSEAIEQAVVMNVPLELQQVSVVPFLCVLEQAQLRRLTLFQSQQVQSVWVLQREQKQLHARQ